MRTLSITLSSDFLSLIVIKYVSVLINNLQIFNSDLEEEKLR